MNNYITYEYDSTGMGGGTKANKDIVRFLKDQNFTDFGIPVFKSNMGKVVFLLFGLSKKLNFKNKARLFILQYPTHSYLISKKISKKVRAQENVKFIILIHDIISLQLFAGKGEKLRKEIVLFNQADGLIVHNNAMKKWLLNNGVTVPMQSLDIFDYDNPQKIDMTLGKYDKTICFAGNLKKSFFLQKLNLKSKFYLYGPNKATDYPNSVKYCGQYPAEEISKYLKYSFGLIWDGTSTRNCDGIFGNYLKYNNPHKASLYLSSGIPVIVWKQAAIAKFVMNNKVGITIDNLDELDEILGKISASEYNQLKKNTLNVALKMRKGYFVKKALAKLTESI